MCLIGLDTSKMRRAEYDGNGKMVTSRPDSTVQDYFRSGCRNVSICHQEGASSGVHLDDHTIQTSETLGAGYMKSS